MTQQHSIESTLSLKEQEQLQEHEEVIARGLKTFNEVGNALLSIRDNTLYREAYKTFEDYCYQRWNMHRAHAYRLMEAAQVTSNLSPIGDIVPTNEAQARPLTQLEPDEQRLVWQVVEKTAPGGKITAAHVSSVVKVLKDVVRTGAIDSGNGVEIPVATATVDHLKAAVTEETYERLKRQETYIQEKQNRGVPAALQSSESNEWYTPADYVNAARDLMGGIDLDPASNEHANQTVKAAKFYSITDDGLKQDWHGRVWLNPPYGRDAGESNQGLWSARLIKAFEDGKVSQAVLLVNAVTDRSWFHPLWEYQICFVKQRIRFYNLETEAGSPTHGSVLVYFGDSKRVGEVFAKFGRIVVPMGSYSQVLAEAA